METFLITKEEYQLIINKLDEVIDILNKENKVNPLNVTWLDISEVCILLKISKRTLQNYRDYGILPFSKVGGKIYFKASDIEKHLEEHYQPGWRH